MKITSRTLPIANNILMEFGTPMKLVKLIKIHLNETYGEFHTQVDIYLMHFLFRMV
jgi:hypothetical protein